jgi:hypothetical protein
MLFVSTSLYSFLQFESLSSYESSEILLFIRKRLTRLGKDSERSAICLILLLVRMRVVSLSRNEKLSSFLI